MFLGKKNVWKSCEDWMGLDFSITTPWVHAYMHLNVKPTLKKKNNEEEKF